MVIPSPVIQRYTDRRPTQTTRPDYTGIASPRFTFGRLELTKTNMNIKCSSGITYNLHLIIMQSVEEDTKAF